MGDLSTDDSSSRIVSYSSTLYHAGRWRVEAVGQHARAGESAARAMWSVPCNLRVRGCEAAVSRVERTQMPCDALEGGLSSFCAEWRSCGWSWDSRVHT